MRKNCHSFFKEMEALRQQMVASAEILGFRHPIVIRYSQELDVLYTQSMRNEYAQKRG